MPTNCCQPELVRVFWPGLSSSDTVDKYANGSFTSTLVSDLIEQGIMYETEGFNSPMICAVLTLGKANAEVVCGLKVISPLPVPTLDLIGGRPDDKIRK